MGPWDELGEAADKIKDKLDQASEDAGPTSDSDDQSTAVDDD